MDKELKESYINRPIEDESYSFEQWLKVKELRKQAIPDIRVSDSTYMAYSEVAEIGDPVYFKPEESNKQRIAGYIINIRNKKDWWKMSADISSALGTFMDVKFRTISYREIEDMSDVEIPPELKSISTERLLKVYKSVLRINTDGYINSVGYPQHVMKAELGLRQHVFSKEDKKVIRKLKK